MSGSAGVDVSSYNAGLKLDTLSGLNFCIAKASEGTGWTDHTYSDFALQAYDMRIPFGAYHFIHTENEEATLEAELFCEMAKPRGNLSLWIDFETYGASAQKDADQLELFIAGVKRHYPKAVLGLYATWTGLTRIWPYRRQIGFGPLWYANPSVPMSDQNLGFTQWDIHQYESLDNIDRDWCPDANKLWRDNWTW